MDKRTQEILDRFIQSWVDTETYLDDLIYNYPGFERLKPLRKFISKLKTEGEDKFFRLGTSIHDLIISRSVENRLRLDQKYIKIECFDNSFYVSLKNGEEVFREYHIDNLSDTRLTNLLETLKHILVD